MTEKHKFLAKACLWFRTAFMLCVVLILIKEGCRGKEAPIEKSFTEQVMSIQRQAGCTKIDAVIGPESTRKINAKVKREKCQQASDWSIRNMPKEKKWAKRKK